MKSRIKATIKKNIPTFEEKIVIFHDCDKVFLRLSGFPEATLIWTRSGSQTRIGEGPELTFDPIRLDQTGEYICTPENSVADGTADVAYLQVLGE